MYHLRKVSGVRLPLEKYLFGRIPLYLESGGRVDKNQVVLKVFRLSFFCTVEAVSLAVASETANKPSRVAAEIFRLCTPVRKLQTSE